MYLRRCDVVITDHYKRSSSSKDIISAQQYNESSTQHVSSLAFPVIKSRQLELANLPRNRLALPLIFVFLPAPYSLLAKSKHVLLLTDLTHAPYLSTPGWVIVPLSATIQKSADELCLFLRIRGNVWRRGKRENTTQIFRQVHLESLFVLSVC